MSQDDKIDNENPLPDNNQDQNNENNNNIQNDQNNQSNENNISKKEDKKAPVNSDTIKIGMYNAEILNVPNEYAEYEVNFKIIVIGNSGVGKTCITNQAVKHVFSNNYQSTIGMEIFSLFVKLNNKVVKLQIWDTCGQEIYRSLITNFYRSSSLAIIVYAIDQKESFKDLDLWIKELKLNNSPDTKLMLVGNKLDLEDRRQVPYEEGKKFQVDFGFLDFFETSAKTGENIKNMFIKVATILYEEYTNYKDSESSASFNSFKPTYGQLIRNKDINDKKKGKGKCCG